MSKYEVGVPNFDPDDVESLHRFVLDELNAISEAILEVDAVLLQVRHVPPTKPRDGMIVLADGTDWDPGVGAGFYGRSNGAWIFLGSGTWNA